MSFIGKKKRLEFENKAEQSTGLRMVMEPTLNHEGCKWKECLTNALILWGVLVGTIGCIVEPFEFPVRMYLVVIATGLLSLMFGFMYYRKLTRVIGYSVIVVGFILSIRTYFWVIRSGFATMANTLMEFMEDYLDLPIERKYTEYFQNSEIPVTMCVIFMAMSLGLLLNIVISESKGSAFTILATFPFVQTALYFDQRVPLDYFAIYLIACACLTLLRSSGHYKLENKKRQGYQQRLKKNQRSYDFILDGRSNLKSALTTGLFVLAVILVTVTILPEDKVEFDRKYDYLKDDTNDEVKQFALVGFYGMLYGGSSGGVSRGRMGETNYIKFDFAVDLILQIPELEDRRDVYLKGYTGSIYEDNQWKNFADAGKSTAKENITLEQTNFAGTVFQRSTLPVDYYYFRLINIDANQRYVYLPYYTSYGDIFSEFKEEDDPQTRFSQGGILSSYVVNCDTNQSYQKLKKLGEDTKKLYSNYGLFKEDYEKEEEYRDFVYRYYLDVPEANREVLDRIIEEEKLGEQEEKVFAIQKLFVEKYEYTLMPGKTPRGEDFVNYFLEENKKGYCEHFASSAVLLLREMGIPARFVAGYHVDASDIADGEELSEEELRKIPVWSRSSKDSEIVRQVEITDESAHAWVEIYIDNLGWVPVEVTPPSEDLESEQEAIDEEAGNSAVSRFVDAFFSAETASTVKNTIKTTALIAVISLILLVIAYLIYGCIYWNYRRKKYAKMEEPQKLFRQMEKYLFRIFRFMKCKRNDKESFEEYGVRLVERGILDVSQTKELFRLIEKARYARERFSEEDGRKLGELIFEIRETQYRRMNIWKKIRFRFGRVL